MMEFERPKRANLTGPESGGGDECRRPRLTDRQIEELDRCLEDFRRNPQAGATWEQVKARIRRA